MSNHAERIRGWTKAHPTKTATVEDILALRGNVVANMEQAGRQLDERLGRAEAAIKEMDTDMADNAEATDEDVRRIDEVLMALDHRVHELERARISARARRVWNRIVAASWRLRMALHVGKEETTT